MTQPRHQSTNIVELEPTYVTVNNRVPAHLVKGTTVNGNSYYAWDICGKEVCISDTKQGAEDSMERALADGVTF